MGYLEHAMQPLLFPTFDLSEEQVGLITRVYGMLKSVSYDGLPGRSYAAPDHSDVQTWGIAMLQRKYGHVLIRTETMVDKIRELIHHAEIDFEDDKAFSNQFYVLANAEDDARKLLGPSMRQMIAGLRLKDLMIEVVDDVMIICDNKNIDPTTAVEMASFLFNAPLCQ